MKYMSNCLLLIIVTSTLPFLTILSKNLEANVPPTDQIRDAQVKEIRGNAVITWDDSHIHGVEKIVVKDLQTNKKMIIKKGVGFAKFNITNKALNIYKYELKAIKSSGIVSQGITIRLIKNWAQKLHPILDYNNKATPQSGIFFHNQAVSQVRVFDIREDENISKLSSAVMQGVINQEQALTYLVWEDLHLTQLNDAGCNYTLEPKVNSLKNKGFISLFNAYKDKFKYLVVWDETQIWSWSMAVMISSQEKGIPVTEAMKNFIINDLGIGDLEIKDIRNQWKDKVDAYNWAMNNLANNCHKKICFSGGLRSDYKDNPWRLYDYSAASKGFMFWLDEKNNQDKIIMTNIFNKMNYPVGSSVFGYGMNDNGDDLNEITNLHNLGFIVSDYYANGSYWCSFPSKSFQQRHGIASEVKPGKIYVAISLSDGDNVQFDMNSLYSVFKTAKNRGDVPVGVTLAACLQELNPPLLEFYYKNMTQNDELTAGPSGFQFIYGDHYSRNGNFDEWLDMTKNWLATAGFHSAHLWQTDELAIFKRYMEKSGVDLLLDGWDKTNSLRIEDKYVNGAIRINQGTHCRKEGDVYNDLIRVSPNSEHPLFQHVYLLTAYYGFDDGKPVVYEKLIRELQRLERERPNTYEFMLPMDLGASIKKYIEAGGIY